MSDTEIIVYRIYDPKEDKYCSSGRGLYAQNGRSIWMSLGAVRVAFKNMPPDIKDRLKIQAFTLEPVEI